MAADAVFAAKVAVARAAGALSRRAGRGGGTTLPGRVLTLLAADAPERLAARLPRGVAMLSATNGKTTTAAMAAAILEPDGRLCRNAGGANLLSGITSTLLQRPPDAQLGLLEVDEAALPEVVRRAPPRALLLANLFRDQLDRYGELELVAGRWRSMADALPPSTRLVLGADDPKIADLAGADDAVTFGVDDPRVALPALGHAADSAFCVRCGHAYEYRAVYLGHLGEYSCPRCGHHRPPLTYAARDIELSGIEPTRFRLDAPDGSHDATLSLPGLYNVYNAVAAVALAAAVGVAPAVAVERLAGFRAAFGRFERLDLDDRDAVLLLIKNPTGANEALRTLAPVLPGATVLLALNDRIADGRDVSWIWDVDFEAALPAVGSVVCSGSRASDIAVRAKYAGVPPERIEVVDGLAPAFDRACALAGPAGTAFVLPTYTAMLDLQRLASDRGLTRPYWEARA